MSKLYDFERDITIIKKTPTSMMIETNILYDIYRSANLVVNYKKQMAEDKKLVLRFNNKQIEIKNEYKSVDVVNLYFSCCNLNTNKLTDEFVKDYEEEHGIITNNFLKNN